jgi:hypothetical protein
MTLKDMTIEIAPGVKYSAWFAHVDLSQVGLLEVGNPPAR